MPTRPRWGFLVLILFILTSGLSSARLGETLDQCGQRYGVRSTNPLFQGSLTSHAQAFKNGVMIEIGFAGWTVERISFSRAQPFSQEEVETLLSANEGGMSWNPWDGDKKAPGLAYMRNDGTIARWSGGMLTMESPVWVEAYRKDCVAQQAVVESKKTLSGF